MTRFLNQTWKGRKSDPVQRTETVIFNPDSELLRQLPVGTVQQLTEASRVDANLSMLARWFDTHQEAMASIFFRIIPQQQITYYEQHRTIAIKDQVGTLLTLIMDLEKLILTKPTPIEEFSMSSSLKSINEAKPFLMYLKLNTKFEEKVQRKIASLCCSVNNAKRTAAASLLSLLCTRDVIPPNLIPIVAFNTMQPEEDFPEINPFRRREVALKKSSDLLIHKLKSISQRCQDPDEIMAILEMIVTQYGVVFQEQYSSLPGDVDAYQFHDFVIQAFGSNEVVGEFLEHPSHETYLPMLKELTSRFPSFNREVFALTTNSLAPLCLPDIKFDGTDVDDLSSVDLIGNTDPQVLLSFLESTQPFKELELIQERARDLEKLTSDWKSVFQYIRDFAPRDYLTEEQAYTYEFLCAFLDGG